MSDQVNRLRAAIVHVLRDCDEVRNTSMLADQLQAAVSKLALCIDPGGCAPPVIVPLGPSPDHHIISTLTLSKEAVTAIYALEPTADGSPHVKVHYSVVSDLKVTGFRGNPTRVVLNSGHEATITQKLIDTFATPSPFDHVEPSERRFCDFPKCDCSSGAFERCTHPPATNVAMVDWENPDDPAVKLFVGFDVEGYVEEYELCGEGGDYSPNEQERVLLVDAIYGVVSNLHEELRKIVPSKVPPASDVAMNGSRGFMPIFALGDRVRKTKGASWQGRIVGFYATHMTPIGYAVESEREPGSVQIYPEAALEALAASEGSSECQCLGGSTHLPTGSELRHCDLCGLQIPEGSTDAD